LTDSALFHRNHLCVLCVSIFIVHFVLENIINPEIKKRHSGPPLSPGAGCVKRSAGIQKELDFLDSRCSLSCTRYGTGMTFEKGVLLYLIEGSGIFFGSIAP